MITPVHTWVAGKTGLHENLNSRTLREWQYAKLRMLVRYARENTRFYRDWPADFRDISGLPFTTPSDIARDPMEFLAIPPGEVERITTLTTSGTTGPGKRIFFSSGDIKRTMEYFAVGMKSLTVAGERAQILISDDTVNSLGYLLRSALERIGVTAWVLSIIPDKDAAIAASADADCLVGMPAELLYMCRTAPYLRPQSILLTADYIPESVIASIGETWKCRVFSHYGTTEAGFGYAVDCGFHDGHHTRDADVLVEIIDPVTGRESAPGEKGEIIMTMLNNEAMPLIRYRTGDISRFIDSPCRCGSGLKRLGRIESRYEDNIALPGGRILNIHLLDEIMFSMPAVRGFEAAFIAGERKNSLCLLVDSAGRIDPGQLASLVPPEVQITVGYGICDPFTRRGKRTLHRDLQHPVFAGLF